MLEVQRLYPQYKAIADRRQSSVPVDVERRSGRERRSQDRVVMDTRLTRDIFEIKSRVNSLQKPEASNVTKVANVQNTEKAAATAGVADSFVKAKSPENTSSIKDYKPSKESQVAAGAIVGALGGVLGAALLGPVAAGVAAGIGMFVGGKFLAYAVQNHLNGK
ncbi:MAG: hypothetical protein PHV37_07585 [Candidatus Gastranaerophilales bacterium]|nr:hypothetical protein [Candidatus Gastranaerophilales bacterium]